MRSLSELKELYRTELRGELMALEADRVVICDRSRICLAISVVLALPILYLVFERGAPAEGIYLPFLIGGLIWGLWVYPVQTRFQKSFKKRIIEPIVHLIDPDLEFRPRDYLSENKFVRADIYRHRIDAYRGEDQVRGRIGATEFEFSEIHAQYKTGSGKRTQWHTLFKGIFFAADFNKHFKGKTYVLSDKAERFFGTFVGQALQSFDRSRGELVRLEDPEFEEAFAVTSDDQIEARYILTPALMRRILDYRRKTGSPVQLSFGGTRVYVTIPFNRNLFEPQIWKSLVDFESVHDYHRVLSLIIGIIEDLNLNTRIWTKD